MYGTPKKLANLVRMWYGNVKAKVRVNGVESEWFETKVGVRQGDPLSFLLFNIFINGLVGKLKSGGGGISIGTERVPVLLFADDMILLEKEEEELNRQMAKIKEYCNEWHLEVSIMKTYPMVVSKDRSLMARILYGQDELECV